MRTRYATLIVATVLAIAACGGDDPQAELAQSFRAGAEDFGLEFDASCVEATAAGVTDEIAEKILAASETDDLEPSVEAVEWGDQVSRCIEVDSFVDRVLLDLDRETSVDIDCVRAALGDVDSVVEAGEVLGDAISTCSAAG